MLFRMTSSLPPLLLHGPPQYWPGIVSLRPASGRCHRLLRSRVFIESETERLFVNGAAPRPKTYRTEYFVNAPPAQLSEFGPSAA